MKKLKFILYIVVGSIAIFLISADKIEKGKPSPYEAKIIERKGPVAKVFSGGSGKLSNGIARIEFEDDLTQFASDISEIKIIVTPVETWSGIYISEVSFKGFTVKSAAGDQNARFNWIVLIVKKISR